MFHCTIDIFIINKENVAIIVSMLRMVQPMLLQLARRLLLVVSPSECCGKQFQLDITSSLHYVVTGACDSLMVKTMSTHLHRVILPQQVMMLNHMV